MKLNHFFLLLAGIVLAFTISIPVYPQRNQKASPAPPAPGNSQNPHFTISQSRHFDIFWKQVDSLSNLGQPQSALDIVNKIYAQAKTEKDDPQVIKAIIYRIRLNSDFQENFLARTIADLRKEILHSDRPARQILQSILAEVYWKYYQNNQYRFKSRTQVKQNRPDSIETWDLKTISDAIAQTYLLSLENRDSLQRIPIGTFDAILDCEPFDTKDPAAQVKAAAKFYPTLYDFLACRALDFFTTSNETPVFSANRFEIDQLKYFSQTADFIGSTMAAAPDNSSPKSIALAIFCRLAAFHINDKDPRALIDAELRRFSFIHAEWVLPGKDSLYTEALRLFEKTHQGSPWSANIAYARAEFLYSQGQLYNPFVSRPHKWEIRSALEICNNAIKGYPDSEGAKNCRILAKSIKNPMLTITAEAAVPVEKPSLALIQFKNVNALFLRLVKSDPEIYAEKSGTMRSAEFFSYLASLPVATSWSQSLPSDGDFQNHSAEIAIPGVTAGFYVLICSTMEDFSDAKQVFSYTPFWSTQIS